MAMPRFNELFTDVLEVLSDGGAVPRSEVFKRVVARKNLSPEELAERLKSGYSRAEDRAHWAAAYLYYAGAVDKPSKGALRITDLGRRLLADHPEGVTLAVLQETDGIKAWAERSKAKKLAKSESVTTISETDFAAPASGTPTEELERAIQELEEETASELLSRLRLGTPAFMERAVLKVLLGLGYGESEEQLFHVGGPYDGGGDGIIYEDKLGLDQIYVQSKRYREGSAISGGEVREFFGAMDTKGIRRGIFITASHFTKEAQRAVEENRAKQVVLIDGERLASLMIRHSIGVQEIQTYSVYRVDENFFEE